MDPLDNLVWHALTSTHREIAQRVGGAARYPSDVSPFGALSDEATADDYNDLRDLVGAGEVGTLFRADVAPPAHWEVLFTIRGVQMIHESALGDDEVDPRIITLGENDVRDMVDLTSRTKPGPFLARTYELGLYLGIRVNDRLVAMAGQRVQTPQYVEISAVCTDDDFVGRGLARSLVLAQCAAIRAEQRIPILHAAHNNDRALALYERLGFTHRRTITGVGLRAPL